MRGPAVRSLLGWSGLAVSFLFVYIAVRDVDLHSFWSTLVQGNYWLLLPALVVLAFAIYLRAVRWRVLFACEPRPPLAAVTSSLLIGYLFNSILPARAGEAARVLALNQRAGTSRFEALGTVVAERVLDVLTLLALFLLAIPFIPEATWMRRAATVGGGAFVLLTVLLIVVAFYGERPVRLVLRPLTVFPNVSSARVERAAKNLVQGLAVFRFRRIAVRALALTVASWLVIAFSFWLCMLSVRLDAGLDAALVVVIAVNLAMILPSGPAGLGVFEAAAVLTLSSFGIDRSHALSYAVVVHTLNVLPLVVVGFVALHRHTLVLRRSRVSGGNCPSSFAAGTTGSGRTSS